MRFDDRLLTVLSQPAGDRRDVAVRWRQLVDLVARAGSNAASPMVVEALETIRADTSHVDEALRSAAARSIAYLPLPFGLLEYFASGDLSVSAPVLAAATLDAGQWQSMLRVADDETRRFIETLHPEMRARNPAELTEALVEPAPEQLDLEPANENVDETIESAESIDDLVQRMSALKQAVEQAPTGPSAPPARGLVQQAPSLHVVVQRIESRRRNRSRKIGGLAAVSSAPSTLFRWECGAGGEIAWVDGVPRGALVGRSLARKQAGDGGEVDYEVVRAFALRAPFRDAALTVAGDGLVSGSWRISGVPAFDPADGRFRGYRGIALREQDEGAANEDNAAGLPDPDSVRELVHEVKTPLNAIIGFAEIIEGQYLGPADRPYLDRAREIVRQARSLLTAIDDVDFVAMVRSSRNVAHISTNLAELFERITPALHELAQARFVELDLPRAAPSATTSTESELAERLVSRMCVSLIEQAARGERLRIGIERTAECWRVSMALPKALAALPGKHLLEDGAIGEQGFSLRLVQRLARMAGLEMVASERMVWISFPRS